MSAVLAARDDAALERELRALADDGTVDPAAVEEALLQSYLFVGYPVALNALALWRRASGRAAPPPSEDDWEGWTERGARVCRTVYGGQYDELRENVRALHPDMERWMVAEGYGKVLGRPGLDLATRELCTVALLAVLDAPRQLYSHLRGALHAGASETDIEAVLADAGAPAGAERRERARAVWDRLRERLAAHRP